MLMLLQVAKVWVDRWVHAFGRKGALPFCIDPPHMHTSPCYPQCSNRLIPFLIFHHTQALGQLGLSRRAADVPPSDRLASAWFKHTPPSAAALLGGLLQDPQHQMTAGVATPSAAAATSPAALEAARGLWSKGDAYYFRAMARLQKLQAAAVTPHRDVGPGEATATVRLCEHAMHLVRRQRDGLGRAAAVHAQLQRASDWLEGLTAVGAATTLAVGAAATTMPTEAVSASPAVCVPPQGVARRWLSVQRLGLERLSVLAREQAMLLATLRDVAAVPGSQQTQVIDCAQHNGAFPLPCAPLIIQSGALPCRSSMKYAFL